MAYTTPDQVRLVAAGDVNASGPDTAAALDDTALTRAISEAETRIDARLGQRYEVPFTAPAPALIVELATSIAVYYATLIARRGSPVDPDDPARLRFNDALLQLADLANGAAIVEGPTIPTTSGSVGGFDPYYGNLFDADDFHLGYETHTRRGR